MLSMRETEGWLGTIVLSLGDHAPGFLTIGVKGVQYLNGHHPISFQSMHGGSMKDDNFLQHA